MSKILVFSDIHITKDSLEECKLILNEIILLCNKYKIDKVYNLGDTVDQINPPSECLDLYSEFVRELNRPILMIVADSHESKDKEQSIINHLSILNNNITIYKQYKDNDKLYIGHYIVNESKKQRGGTVSVNNLKQYNQVLLGHGHSHEVIGNVTQLGSVRYISFSEAQDSAKKVAICLNYEENPPKWEYIDLKAPFSMFDIVIDKLVDKAPNVAKNPIFASNWGIVEGILNDLSPKSKVRLIFKDFDIYSKSINNLSLYKNKFNIFQVKKDFIIQNTITNKSNISLKDNLINYLNINNISNNIKNILLKEIK